MRRVYRRLRGQFVEVHAGSLLSERTNPGFCDSQAPFGFLGIGGGSSQPFMGPGSYLQLLKVGPWIGARGLISIELSSPELHDLVLDNSGSSMGEGLSANTRPMSRI